MKKNKISNKIKKSDSELTKEERIYKEYLKMKKIYKFLPKNTFLLYENLIKSAAFHAITLEELQVIINANGYSEEYQNGKNQSGLKKTPEVDTYCSYVKNYNTIIKTLNELLPKETPIANDADGLLRFAARV